MKPVWFLGEGKVRDFYLTLYFTQTGILTFTLIQCLIYQFFVFLLIHLLPNHLLRRRNHQSADL